MKERDGKRERKIEESRKKEREGMRETGRVGRTEVDEAREEIGVRERGEEQREREG